MRVLVLALAAGCCLTSPLPSPAPAPIAPPLAPPSLLPSGTPSGSLATGVTEAPPSGIPPVMPPSVITATDRCEGLVGPCGGWNGCVMVRADATTPGRFVGVGPNAGHFYSENHDCYAGVCNEVCTGGSLSACRPGVTEEAGPIICSAAMPPSHAPFTCTMVSGTCVQGPDPSMIPAS